jgi:hypothetical protein
VDDRLLGIDVGVLVAGMRDKKLSELADDRRRRVVGIGCERLA